MRPGPERTERSFRTRAAYGRARQRALVKLAETWPATFESYLREELSLEEDYDPQFGDRVRS